MSALETVALGIFMGVMGALVFFPVFAVFYLLCVLLKLIALGLQVDTKRG